MNRIHVHIPRSGPDAPHSAVVEGGSGEKPVSPTPKNRRSSRRRLGARGQTLVEFTLILPVALLMTVGIIDFARLFAAYISLTNGVREAALYAGAGGYTDTVGITDHINSEAAGMDTALITIAAPVCDLPCENPPGTPNPAARTVTISATYQFVPLTPMITLITGSPIMLTTSTTAQIRYVAGP